MWLSDFLFGKLNYEKFRNSDLIFDSLKQEDKDRLISELQQRGLYESQIKNMLEKKQPCDVYEEFIRSNKTFDELNEETKQELIHYIGVQCSNFVDNNYPVRVTEEDILKHLRREVNILSLEEHIAFPTKNSPKEIRLGGYLWKLDLENLWYAKEVLNNVVN